MIGYLERADLVFYALAVEIGIGAPCLLVETEGNLNVGHGGLEFSGLHATVVVEETMTEGVEGH